ncbi:hypothetical protein Gasu2_61350 [Galdieria sulphuraria]|nr:hypothetical protein Gasu2_61350 [Galdieria sulphuraria]
MGSTGMVLYKGLTVLSLFDFVFLRFLRYTVSVKLLSKKEWKNLKGVFITTIFHKVFIQFPDILEKFIYDFRISICLYIYIYITLDLFQ